MAWFGGLARTWFEWWFWQGLTFTSRVKSQHVQGDKHVAFDPPRCGFQVDDLLQNPKSLI